MTSKGYIYEFSMHNSLPFGASLVGGNHKLHVPVLSARMGVTNTIDAGVMYTKNPGSNYSWAGIGFKYTFQQEEYIGID